MSSDLGGADGVTVSYWRGSRVGMRLTGLVVGVDDVEGVDGAACNVSCIVRNNAFVVRTCSKYASK